VISIDASVGIQIVNFLVLIVILNLLLYKPILGIVAKRKKQLAESEGEVARLRERVDERMAAYEVKLLEAKTEALERKNEIIGQGATEAAAAIAAVRDEIPGMIDQFQARMEEQITDAKGILADHSRRLSRDIAEKVLGRSIP